QRAGRPGRVAPAPDDGPGQDDDAERDVDEQECRPGDSPGGPRDVRHALSVGSFSKPLPRTGENPEENLRQRLRTAPSTRSSTAPRSSAGRPMATCSTSPS